MSAHISDTTTNIVDGSRRSETLSMEGESHPKSIRNPGKILKHQSKIISLYVLVRISVLGIGNRKILC